MLHNFSGIYFLIKIALCLIFYNSLVFIIINTYTAYYMQPIFLSDLHILKHLTKFKGKISIFHEG